MVRKDKRSSLFFSILNTWRANLNLKTNMNYQMNRADTDTSKNRYFSYFITVSGLTVGYVILLLWLIALRRLLPSIVIIGAFVLFVLWLVGLIVISLELWNPKGGVSVNCDRLVWDNPRHGNNFTTLAWLQQRSICEFDKKLQRSLREGLLVSSWENDLTLN